ncbi:MAG: isoprenylcysteine carboxylmethyltransferase family protein [Acidobacteria bacterium]|nr:isoprenylcysteine carboxylmethyltransferase family protein [Acidobacteriota bacterium]
MTPYQRMFGSGPLLLLLVLVLIVGAVELQKITGLPRPELSLPLRLGLTGVVLVVGGTVIIQCFRTLSLRKRGRELVTTGPYHYVRHPLYTAVFLTAGLAVFFITQTYFALLAIAFMFLAGHISVRSEERRMEQHFGQAWRDYAQRTPRFFPRPMSRQGN